MDRNIGKLLSKVAKDKNLKIFKNRIKNYAIGVVRVSNLLDIHNRSGKSDQ